MSIHIEITDEMLAKASPEELAQCMEKLMHAWKRSIEKEKHSICIVCCNFEHGPNNGHFDSPCICEHGVELE